MCATMELEPRSLPPIHLYFCEVEVCDYISCGCERGGAEFDCSVPFIDLLID